MPGIGRQTLHRCFQRRDVPGAGGTRHEHRREVTSGLNKRLDRSLFRLLRRFLSVIARVSSSDGWFHALQSLPPSCCCPYTCCSCLKVPLWLASPPCSG